MRSTPLKITASLSVIILMTACHNPYDFATKNARQSYNLGHNSGVYQFPAQKQYGYAPSAHHHSINPYNQAYLPPNMASQYLAVPAHSGYNAPYYGQDVTHYAEQARQYNGYNHNNRLAQRITPQRGGLNLNYETLSVFEAPLAKEIGDVTFLLRGRVDAPLTYSFENDDDKFDATLVGNHQISAETQLPNRLTVGAVYAGRAYENNDIEYDDEIAAYVGGSWGTVFAGNVSDLVYEQTRRQRGASIVELVGDRPLGQMDKWSAGYRGRYGPVIVSGLIDEDNDYDVGVTFQRPIGNKDYRLTARHNTGKFTAEDGLTEIDTRSVNAVGEYVYGSTRYDIGGGFEQLTNGANEVDRWYTSAGFTTKQGVWSLSAEGHYGEIDGQEEISGLIGVRYDIARGLAATAALDYQDRQINVGGVDYINNRDTRAILALSYGF